MSEKHKWLCNWDKTTIELENGDITEAQAPLIISASRRTDILAFYSEWFFNRLKKGYCAWINPFNNKKVFIDLSKTRFIVFWSKNPVSLLNHIDYLNDCGIGFYIQYTLNDYEKEGLETRVPPLCNRLKTLEKLVDKLGKERIIWRFDPLLLADNISIDELILKIEYIGDQLRGLTDKLVFSFIDIAEYRKVGRNLKAAKIPFREWTREDMIVFSQKLSELNIKKRWDYMLATCGENIDLEAFGVVKNHCVDEDLIIRLAYKDAELMHCMSVELQQRESLLLPTNAMRNVVNISKDSEIVAIKNRSLKDHGQRKTCLCMVSKDIGQYDVCPHLCEYCYANTSKKLALNNWQRHMRNPFCDTITGI